MGPSISGPRSSVLRLPSVVGRSTADPLARFSRAPYNESIVALGGDLDAAARVPPSPYE